MLLAVCSGELERGDHGERPRLHSVAGKAMKPQGESEGADEEEERAMDAVLEATIRYNWACSGHNGMRMAGDKQKLLLASAAPPPPVFLALRSEDFGQDPHADMETTSQRGAKRARELEGSRAASTAGTGT